jgi:hypothetical protein
LVAAPQAVDEDDDGVPLSLWERVRVRVFKLAALNL